MSEHQEATRVSNGTVCSKRPPMFEDRTDICLTYFLSADFTLSFSLHIWAQIRARALHMLNVSITDQSRALSYLFGYIFSFFLFFFRFQLLRYVKIKRLCILSIGVFDSTHTVTTCWDVWRALNNKGIIMTDHRSLSIDKQAGATLRALKNSNLRLRFRGTDCRYLRRLSQQTNTASRERFESHEDS